MARNGKTKGYYLPDDLIRWLEETAPKKRRSVSNFLAFIVQKEKDASETQASA